MSNEKDGKPSFGARPNTKTPDFDFKKELERLPFEFNIGTLRLLANSKRVSLTGSPFPKKSDQKCPESRF